MLFRKKYFERRRSGKIKKATNLANATVNYAGKAFIGEIGMWSGSAGRSCACGVDIMLVVIVGKPVLKRS